MVVSFLFYAWMMQYLIMELFTYATHRFFLFICLVAEWPISVLIWHQKSNQTNERTQKVGAKNRLNPDYVLVVRCMLGAVVVLFLLESMYIVIVNNPNFYLNFSALCIFPITS
jgi:hypothetical protein